VSCKNHVNCIYIAQNHESHFTKKNHYSLSKRLTFLTVLFGFLPPQMFLEYGFHPRVQRWVIGQCLCTDQRSLASYGVRQAGDTAFLYLLSARHARLTLQVLQQDQESSLLLSPPSLSLPTPPLTATSANGPSSLDRRPYVTLPTKLHTSSNTGE